ncbi:hypothetical protein Tco_1331741 [Tanacetum coccineum]
MPARTSTRSELVSSVEVLPLFRLLLPCLHYRQVFSNSDSSGLFSGKCGIGGFSSPGFEFWFSSRWEQLGDASIEIQAYTQALKKVEAQLVAHQKNQLWYEEKIRFMKIDLDDKTDVLTYHKKLLAEAVKEKEELKTKLESFETSSKSLNTLLNSQLSANDKAGFGHNGAKESKVSETITSVSKVKTSNSETSNDKVEMPKIKTVRMSEPIIEEWESDSEDDEIVIKPKEVTKIVKPSFEKIKSVNAGNETVRQAENPRKNNKSPRGNKRNWNGMMT